MQAMTTGPQDRTAHPPSQVLAAATLVFYGLLLVGADLIGVRREAGLSAAPVWSLLHLVAVAGLAFGILRARRWAWWGALVLSAVALFLVAPVLIALMAGSGLTQLVGRADVALVCLEGATLLFLVVLLVRTHRQGASPVTAPPSSAAGR